MTLTLESLIQLRDAYLAGARSLSTQIDQAARDRVATLGAADALTKLIDQERKAALAMALPSGTTSAT